MVETKIDVQYKTKKEWLGVGWVGEYLFIIQDESFIKYSVGRKARALESKERLRAVFLVKLIEEYGYQEKDVRIDLELKNGSFIDIVVFKDEKPFIVLDVNGKDQEAIFKKAKKVGAKYAGIISKSKKRFFNVALTQRSVPVKDIPTNTINTIK